MCLFYALSDEPELYALAPQEIQLGILKRLKGSPIIRHTQAYAMRYNPNPPYAIVANNAADYKMVQDMVRFARFWDLIGNSGHFSQSLSLLMGDKPFWRFLTLSKAIFENVKQTHKIGLLRLYDTVFWVSSEYLEMDVELLKHALSQDHQKSGLKSLPIFLQKDRTELKKQGKSQHNMRQQRH